ncbi:hypothetical protein [Mesorhizobium sp. ANAO-SY3R2]|uniref:hypothetical protein n=1 Tax=Mesorhizobium sp. ANAO-SY3R2 TaxID=3166644 RepID=UPI00366D09F9
MASASSGVTVECEVARRPFDQHDREGLACLLDQPSKFIERFFTSGHWQPYINTNIKMVAVVAMNIAKYIQSDKVMVSSWRFSHASYWSGITTPNSKT